MAHLSVPNSLNSPSRDVIMIVSRVILLQSNRQRISLLISNALYFILRFISVKLIHITVFHFAHQINGNRRRELLVRYWTEIVLFLPHISLISGWTENPKFCAGKTWPGKKFLDFEQSLHRITICRCIMMTCQSGLLLEGLKKLAPMALDILYSHICHLTFIIMVTVWLKLTSELTTHLSLT